MTRSEQLYSEAKQYMPGGVNSPVRAFGSIADTPRFIAKADGPYVWDVDGCRYIDYVGSWGPMLLGHNQPDILNSVTEACKRGLSYGAATKAEVDMAKLVCEMVPSIEMVRMVNSGTEAVMSAIRAARGYTHRDKIIKFEGCYHGHSDGLLVKAGSGVLTQGVPDSDGVPKGCTQDTLTAIYNCPDSVKAHFKREGEQIAAVIVEPVAANMGVVVPQPGFLETLRELCTTYGALLIFDEVITGFRLCEGGAQAMYRVTPDLTVFGKIIGAGLPVGAYGGKRRIMEVVSPLGGVYQAGTLSGNPIAMAAGHTMLQLLHNSPDLYKQLNTAADHFFTRLQTIIKKAGFPYQVSHIGSLGCLFFTDHTVTDYESAKTSDTAAYAKYCRHMLQHGIYLAPAQFEAMFLSTAHGQEQLEETLDVVERYFAR